MSNTIGVVVGRFQVDEPHEGHIALLDAAQEQSDQLIVILGAGPLPTSSRKPLPFETRKSILSKYYPDAYFYELNDHPDDDIWSKQLDSTIEIAARLSVMILVGEPVYDVQLFHSRDSFANYYTGKYDLVYVDEADIGKSGTLHRKHIAKMPLGTQDFAKGVIWANENRFPTVYGAVDAMVFRYVFPLDRPDQQILLITKQGRPGFMFPGGFTDPTSVSDEEDAAREVLEECNIKVDQWNMEYLGSQNVEDWRYTSEPDCIRSRMFITTALESRDEPEAGDDAETAQWVDFHSLTLEDMNPCHKPLLHELKEYFLK